MLYNGTGGQLPVHPEGKVMYYANYFLDGAVKTVEDRRLMESGHAFEWQCCTGTFPQDVAEYANLLYYFDDDSLYVSQYLPSVVDWEKDGRRIRLENYSRYPEESRIRFRIHVDRAVGFNLKLRVPDWAKGRNRLVMDGHVVETEIVPNTWVTLTREWQDGDIVEIEFPFSLYFKSVDDTNKEIAALNYGPIVLVADKMTQFIGDVDKPSAWIRPVAGKPFTFETDPGHVQGYGFLTRTFMPYYKIGEMQWYYMYNRIYAE